MCGFAGFVLRRAMSAGEAAQVLGGMAAAIAHRGPDDEGVWFDPQTGIGLAHRRLSIVDLTEAGHQPMASPSGRYVIAFNGEIYNHMDLRARLEAQGAAPIAWRGHADTETLMAAIDVWGLKAALQAASGMFALALWDRQTRTLSLARDRFGEKPLYYGWSGGEFLFGSELKALRCFPGFAPGVDRAAAAAFIARRYIPDGASIYTGVRRLPPAHILQLAPSGEIREETFWSLADAAHRPRFQGSPEEAVGEVERLLAAAVRRQMQSSDVPVGAFLSGGVDSSLVTALMQAADSGRVRTFCIGFENSRLNEAPHAAEIAARLGVEHTELLVTDEEAAGVAPHIADIWDEPFADGSQIPTALLARMTRREVTVCLTGDGGDELFNGYSRHRIARLLGRLPGKRVTAMMMAATPLSLVAGVLRRAPHRRLSGMSIERVAGLRESLAQTDAAERYLHMLYRPRQAARLLADPPPPGPLYDGPDLNGAEALGALSLIDLHGYLPDDILVKVDRATMAVGLEARAPFLDHQLAEFALTLPDAIRHREGRSKWPLRRLLDRYAPASQAGRPKAGFEAPIGEWLRGRLRPWAEYLIHPSAPDDLLSQPELERVWTEHQRGRDRSATLWPALIYRAWAERWG